MSITIFRPKVWSATLLSVLAKSLVYGGPQCVNRNYEGDIANYGDSVQITAIDDPTISDYTKDTDLGDVEALTDTGQVLTIDQAKAFNFQVDNIDMRQARAGGALMTEAAFRAGFKLRDTADQFLAGLMMGGAQSANAVSAVTTSDATDAYDKVLVPLSEKLDEANVPEEGRFVVVAPSLYSQLLLDSRFIKVNESGSSAGLRNGNVGGALGFTILKSNNTPTNVRTTSADGTTTASSKTLTSATAKFTQADVGSKVDDGGTQITAGTTIASVESATSVTMSANAKAAGTTAAVTIGTTGQKVVIAGSNIATTYAEQINKVVAYQPEKRFADALKGLHLYGAKVIRPEALATCAVVIGY